MTRTTYARVTATQTKLVTQCAHALLFATHWQLRYDPKAQVPNNAETKNCVSRCLEPGRVCLEQTRRRKKEGVLRTHRDAVLQPGYVQTYRILIAPAAHRLQRYTVHRTIKRARLSQATPHRTNNHPTSARWSCIIPHPPSP